ncbi:MAG TPA: cephalosporin hydroxylase [Planctomycetales bacterium]|jgi:cephalosporin hydroxylase|nr:cephalosporin hydroxylase [Planctomycetales bacterium]
MRSLFASLRNASYRLRTALDRRFLKRRIARRFHQLYYGSGVDRRTNWLGKPVWKCPLDLWVYQEILFETRPDVIVECGTALGGSAFFYASVCDLLQNGRIVTIDMQRRPGLVDHPRIRYLVGSSIDPEIVSQVRTHIADAKRVMVVLDSNHACEHVLKELRLYGPLVSRGNYLVVEDSNINGHPVLPSFGPGPMEAIQEFMRESKDFVIDSEREKFFVTYNPMGYLRRV